MRFFRWLSIIIALLVIIYVLGPSPKTPDFATDLPAVPANADSLENYIRRGESLHKLKPDNEARIVWNNDSLKNKTPYAILYLHGFGASQGEGYPIHRNFAKQFGCNLYLSRLAEHGIDTSERLLNFSADKYWNSAKEAYAIAKQLGEKVVIVGTSSGGTLALMLAAQRPEIAGLILLSPNVAIFDKNAWIANNHWGLQVAKLIRKGNYIEATDSSEGAKKYWAAPYRIEAIPELEELLETSMNKATFEKVKQPVLMMYYYGDEQHQDNVVSVSAMKEMFEELGTPATLKKAVDFPEAGDHVIGSPIKSRAVKGVQKEMNSFAIEELKMQVADSTVR